MPTTDVAAARSLASNTRPTSVRMRPAELADHPGIAALQTRHGLSVKTFDDWRALWLNNPAHLRFGKAMPAGWVLESVSGEITGFLGNLPLAYRFRDRDVVAATAHSWVVDDSHRGYSIALLDTFLKQEPADLFIFATVNSQAENVLRAFRLHRVPVPGWDTARFWITGYRGFARGAITASAMPLPELWAPPVAGALWMRDLLFRGRIPQMTCDLGSDYRLETCAQFDDHFDTFWNDSVRQNREKLLAARDASTLTWHYGPAMRRGSLWAIAVTLRGRIVAYWTVDRQDHEDLGLKRLRFVDFQALAGFENLLRTAVAWTLRRCCEEGLHIADNLGSWLARYGVPGTVGPYRRQMKSWLFYYRARGELATQLQNPDVWIPTSYDGDASL